MIVDPVVVQILCETVVFALCSFQITQNICLLCSCGLWVLLHSLSVRVEDGESEMAFKATCDFIHNFFLCDECREHFYELCSR